MPVYESACLNPQCEHGGQRFEWYASTMSKPDPFCESCGAPTRRMVSNFAAPWTGDLERFNDPTKEKYSNYGGGGDGGHFAMRVRSSRNLNGSPERVLIRTRQDQKEFCREEGLIMPDDVGQHVEVGEDGMSCSSQGMPGSWANAPASMEQGTTRKTKSKPTYAGAW